MANYTWPPAPAAVIGAETEDILTEYGKEPNFVFDPDDWVIPGGPFDAGTINDMVVAIEDIADVLNEMGAELDSNYIPIDIDINGAGGQSYPPNYNPAYGEGVRANMQQYVGDSWDGSIPSDVTMITTWTTRHDLGNPPPGAPSDWDGDIGPGGGFPARANTWNFYLPPNGEVYSSKWSLNKSVNGFIQLGWVPAGGGTHGWHDAGYSTIIWMSSSPGGNPHMGYDGNPHMFKFNTDTACNFGTYYDRDLISVGKGLSSIDSPPDENGYYQTMATTSKSGAAVVRRTRAPYGGKTWETYMLSSGGDYVFPVIEKTYFLNWAMVRSSKASDILRRGTPPTASERKPLNGLIPSQQYGFMQQLGAFDVITPPPHKPQNPLFYTLGNYLDYTRYKILDSHRGYIALDETMADFMWDSNSSFLSDSEYTPISSGNITMSTNVNDGNKTEVSDIGFEGPDRYESTIWSRSYFEVGDRVRYAIPQDGKISTMEFTTAYGSEYLVPFEQQNSTFDLGWTPHNDDKTRAWYDLGLTPVMWMSAEPGGEPQPTYDKSKGVVIAIHASGATYEAQQILSTTEVQFVGGSTRATFPITNHKYYVNVGVVENDVAIQLETSGIAPTVSQLKTWSINDPSLEYTPTDEQLMYLNGRRGNLGINGGGL